MDTSLPVVAGWVVSPAFLIALTLGAFVLGQRLSETVRHAPLANPVVIALGLVSVFLIVVDVPYAEYSAATSPLQFLLGVAVVALAIPMYRQLERIRNSAGPFLIAIAAGSCCAVVSALAVLAVLGTDPALLPSMAPKSVTTPVAILIAPRIGGIPALTAVFVIATGILGYVLGPPLLDRLGITEPAARGLAYGTASHIIGTSRAVRESELAAACAGLALSLNAFATAVLLPPLWALFSPAAPLG